MADKKNQAGQVARGAGKRPFVMVILHDEVKDFVYADGLFRWLKRNFENADFVLLTSTELKELGKMSGHFKHVWVDPMFEWWELYKCWKFRKKIKSMNVSLVIDLQQSKRTAWYYRLYGQNKPSWSSAEPLCTFPYRRPEPADLEDPNKFIEPHILDHYAAQISTMGLEVYADELLPDLSWLNGDVSGFGVKENYVLFAPVLLDGEEPFGWDINTAASFIDYLDKEKGLRTILVGESDTDGFVKRLLRRCDVAKPVNLVGHASLAQVAEYAKGAAFAIGNDRGELYLAAHVGCPTVFLFSVLSSVERTVPSVHGVRVIKDANISGISLQYVLDVLDGLLGADDNAAVYQTEDFIDVPAQEEIAAVTENTTPKGFGPKVKKEWSEG
jgi:ADP-heptose:LPS heptosyltransferase